MSLPPPGSFRVDAPDADVEVPGVAPFDGDFGDDPRIVAEAVLRTDTHLVQEFFKRRSGKVGKSGDHEPTDLAKRLRSVGRIWQAAGVPDGARDLVNGRHGGFWRVVPQLIRP